MPLTARIAALALFLFATAASAAPASVTAPPKPKKPLPTEKCYPRVALKPSEIKFVLTGTLKAGKSSADAALMKKLLESNASIILKDWGRLSELAVQTKLACAAVLPKVKGNASVAKAVLGAKDLKGLGDVLTANGLSKDYAGKCGKLEAKPMDGIEILVEITNAEARIASAEGKVAAKSKLTLTAKSSGLTSAAYYNNGTTLYAAGAEADAVDTSVTIAGTKAVEAALKKVAPGLTAVIKQVQGIGCLSR